MADRRRFLRGLCAAPVAVTPALAFGAVIDPAFAAIQRHREAVAAIDAIPIDDDGPVYEAACEVEEACLQALARVMPTTPAGAAALLEHMIKRESHFISEERTGSPFEIMARTVATALRQMGAGHLTATVRS